MSDAGPPTGLITVLVKLRECLLESPIRLAAADAAEGNRERSSMLAQLEDYVIPRLVQVEAPVLVVVGGSTGAGKSTLVNSLAGRVVSPPGVLRPTTRSAVLAHNPVDGHWFGADRMLPDLERTDGATDDPSSLRLIPVESLPVGLALLDAPDVDSVETGNRVLAGQLLDAADLWVFITSAARYADQVPWDYLKAAAARSTAVAIVLDRTAASVMREVSSHLARMLDSRGLGDSRLFTIAESPLSDEGLLPAEETLPIRQWLESLATDSVARADVIRTTLDGAIASLQRRTEQVASALNTQEQLASILRSDVTSAYGEALAAVEAAAHDGPLRRGETLSLSVAGESGLRSLILEYAETAAEHAAIAWRSLPAGAQLLASSGDDLGRASGDLTAAVEGAILDWRAAVEELVRTSARGDQLGAEPAVRAQADLRDRVEALWDAERARYFAVLDAYRPPIGAGERLRTLGHEVSDARFAWELA